MSNTILIMGESGTGKSTSLRNLNPEETYIINVLDKPLPFKGFKSKYQQKVGGNYFANDNASKILNVIMNVNTKCPHVKSLIIDDFQYIMANEYMRRATERGFDKFTEIGQAAWNIISECSRVRDDLDVFILSHTESNDMTGKIKCKTIGKMIDNTITLEGMFTVVLHSMLKDDKYVFLTQHDGRHIAKSPLGMFEDMYIPNDLLQVKSQIQSYGEI